MYLHLFEIAVYLSLRTIEEQTEFQFAFRYKMKWNNIFQASNCRQKFRFSLCKKNGSKCREFIDMFNFPTYFSLSPSSTKLMTNVPYFKLSVGNHMISSAICNK